MVVWLMTLKDYNHQLIYKENISSYNFVNVNVNELLAVTDILYVMNHMDVGKQALLLFSFYKRNVIFSVLVQWKTLAGMQKL